MQEVERETIVKSLSRRNLANVDSLGSTWLSDRQSFTAPWCLCPLYSGVPVCITWQIHDNAGESLPYYKAEATTLGHVAILCCPPVFSLVPIDKIILIC